MSEDTGVIGRQLREARERMGLGVAQAAERLHVDENVIGALESGDFETLGPPVYVRGHLRHYAELVGEPSASGLYESLSQTQPDLTSGPHRPMVPQRPPRRRWPLVLFAALLALAVAAWWASGVKLG